MDALTLAIEACGLVILLIWVIVPIQEFRLIARRLRESPSETRPPDQEGRQ